MVIAIVAVFAVVVFLARGRGGALSVERADYVPLDLGPVSATDVALLRPPTGLWGYNMQATDEAMDQIAESIRERDVRIVALEQLVTDLSRDHAPAMPLASPYQGARHRRMPGETAGMYQPQDFYPLAGAEPEPPMTQPSRTQPPVTQSPVTQSPVTQSSWTELPAQSAEPRSYAPQDSVPPSYAPQFPAAEPDGRAGDPDEPAAEEPGLPPEQSHD
jgi:hypothetical protein